MSLYIDFKNTALKNKNKKAAFFHNKFYTYSNLLTLIDELSSYLQDELHLHQSVTVSLCLDNSLYTLALIYACNKLGIIVNFINPNLASDQILFFDLMLKSRLLFISKKAYLDNINVFKNVKTKLVLVDFNKPTLKDKILYHKNKARLDVGVPFTFKNKRHNKSIETTPIAGGNVIALTAPNEKFDEVPYLVCASNEKLHFATINQSEIYQYLNQDDVFWPESSMMSISLFMTYYHAPLINGICVCLDDTNSDKQFIKIIKSNKITVFGGDISSYSRLFLIKDKIISRFINNLNRAYIYNDIEKSYILNAWNKKCCLAMKQVEIFSILGLVEMLGGFTCNKIDDVNINDFGSFLGDIKGEIIKDKRKYTFGRLKLSSTGMMIGYYKNADKNQEVLDENGCLLTNLYGNIDVNGHFFLGASNYANTPYMHNSPYLLNIRDLLMTIPGVKDVDVTVCLNKREEMELTISSDKDDCQRLTSELSSYLDTQLKNKNIDYKIKFKE